jgi:ABC-type transport system substrate-binding protein
MYSDSDLYPDSETLTVSLSDVKQIPWSTIDTYTYELETFGAAVFGSLTEINESGIKNISHDDVLLKSYKCDEKECPAELKKGIHFHNGREVNAYDLEFSFMKELLSHKNNSFAYSMLKDIDGVEEFFKNKTEIKFWKKIDDITYPSGFIKGIEVIDKYNFILHMKNKNKYIFQTLSTAFLPIVPIEELKDDYAEWKQLPIGFGRYEIVKSDLKNFEFILKKHRKNDNITKYVRLLFGSNPNVDIRLSTQQTPLDVKTEEVHNASGVYGNGGFLFNFKTKLGSNENFRKAINFALDRKRICNLSKYNEITPENQLLPNHGWQGIYRADIPITEQDIEKAKYHLNLVPHELWKNKILKVHSFWTANKNLSETPYFIEIKQELSKIGLEIVFYNTDMDYTKFNKEDENVLWWTGFDLQTEQPNSNFSYFQEGSFFNNIYPNDPEFNRLYYLSEKNLHKGTDDTRNLSLYFTSNNIMVVVFNLRNSFIYKKNRIKSFGNQISSVKLQLTDIKLNNSIL